MKTLVSLLVGAFIFGCVAIVIHGIAIARNPKPPNPSIDQSLAGIDESIDRILHVSKLNQESEDITNLQVNVLISCLRQPAKIYAANHCEQRQRDLIERGVHLSEEIKAYNEAKSKLVGTEPKK